MAQNLSFFAQICFQRDDKRCTKQFRVDSDVQLILWSIPSGKATCNVVAFVECEGSLPGRYES
jgi:hypothetical protein